MPRSRGARSTAERGAVTDGGLLAGRRVVASWVLAIAALSACGRSTSGVHGAAGTGGAGTGGAGTSGVGTRDDGLPLPIAGEHAIESRGCDAEPIGPEFLIQPTLACRRAPDYDPVTNRTAVCEVEEYCTTHADCTQQPFGRCQGTPNTQCVYPSEPCDADEQCKRRPNGSCPELSEDRRCNAEGECWPIRRECFYPSDACESDGNCAAGAGVCQKLVLFARCVYQGCGTDSDCGAGERCACSNGTNACVPADCTADADCETGETCLLDVGCRSASAFHCTSPADTCRSDEDCATSRCEYGAGRFQCERDPCPLD